MRSGFIRKAGLMLATIACAVAAPAAAQFSDAYTFLKAVRDRDGNAATKFLNEPGSTVVNTRDLSTGETALHIVVQRRDEIWTKFLLDRGADPNAGDRSGVVPLTIAANLGFVEGVAQLLRAGARVDVVNSTGETPLISAVHRRDTAIIRVLLANGANPDKADSSGRSARDYAKLMGASSGVMQEIERAEAARAGSADNQGAYGPTLRP